ncbi:ribosome silencing factor [Pseudoclavibacter sp. RFBJ3]|uniref:ribosome silencing factor n=1 Tax=unclassified Pseudoclavibacter TaxID=2615177 RepID=UPI000CE7BB24|nr:MULTISPECIES: ribosome silencing factor [unclassified Pseudoclavibacter]MBF4551934.1 ribosome silencing factor [Pseudoclavibacter sp. VKM Ac-2888]PPF85352.1 ribosome silencing factor [Pseudoclavibacter sp. RFBJ5]PPF93351.1 ribosome silencing factor [Pseudoclavibacter sp. RFBJ3]PPF98983.1 ribosome silencing factor [Pseudoclavibacter sp. RFBH5]PPG04036.1 ribosome silencing factor [Pseudoclavibacter sp. RFBI5]
MTASTRAIELADIAAKAADKRLGFDIVALDVSNNMPLTDIFLLVSGRNERMVLSIADEIEDAMRDIGQRTLRREGRREGRWVLLDFNDIVVHVFHEEERTFYGLERLWNDAPVVKLDLGEGDAAAEQPNQAEQS